MSLLAHHQWLQAAVLAGLIWGGVDAYRHGWSRRSLGLVYVCLSFMVALLAGDVVAGAFIGTMSALWTWRLMMARRITSPTEVTPGQEGPGATKILL